MDVVECGLKLMSEFSGAEMEWFEWNRRSISEIGSLHRRTPWPIIAGHQRGLPHGMKKDGMGAMR
jgi:hypothetical protein